MMGVWLDGFTRVGSYAGGVWSDSVEMKIVLHTVEGGIEAARGVFAQGSRPHLLVSPPSRDDGPVRLQYLSLDESAFALVNRPGYPETNTDGAIQVEIAGYAAEAPGWPDEDLDWLGREVIAPIRAAVPGITLEHPIFYGQDAGWVLATPTARQRMSAEEWDLFAGVCGHQHVPENDHWDPGGLDIVRVLAAAGGASEPFPDLSAILESPMSTILHGTDDGKPATFLLREGEPAVQIAPALAANSTVIEQIGTPDNRAGAGVTNQLVVNAAKAAGFQSGREDAR